MEKMKLACLQKANGFILPSLSEGLPVAVLEAWSCALPVIMTPQCNLPEGFEARAAIKVFPETNSITEGLKRFFLLTEQEQKAIGQRGMELVRNRFCWPEIAKQMISVYAWLLGESPRPDCVRSR
jgi:poly(glycerol-phosphate) alpha-glucosyltransferase